MIAKKTSENQVTLPRSVVEQFPDIDCFDVRIEGGGIMLVPVPGERFEKVQSRMEELGLTEQDVRDAVAWARGARS